jgi:hypothetical protein
MFQRYLNQLTSLSIFQKSLIVVVVYIGLVAVAPLVTPSGKSSVPTAPRAKVASAQIRHDTVVTTEEIPFTTITNENPQLAAGVTRVTTPGVTGVRTHSYDVTYTNGVETKRVEIANLVTVGPVDQVQEVGTGTGSTSPRPRCENEATFFGISYCRLPRHERD